MPEIIPPPGYKVVREMKDGQEVVTFVKPKKKKVDRVKPMPNYNVPYERIEGIVESWELPERYKYFFIISYLLGSRVSETLELRRGDFEIVNKEGVDFLDVTVVTMKTRDERKYTRVVPIPLNGYEGKLVEMVLRFIRNFGSREKLFNFNRFTAWRVIKKIDFGNMNLVSRGKREFVNSWYGHPHYLRHVRATHLKRYYDFDDEDEMEYFGWSSPEMAARYAPTTHDDLLVKYRKKVSD